jgi:DNA-binding ferritin-like protein (Dps family)
MVLGHDVSHFCDSLMYGELSGASLRQAFRLIEEK